MTASEQIGVRGKPDALHLLQVIRGLAAVGVVCYHAALLLHEKAGSAGLGLFLSWGFSGVHIFFVLSGFIICLIHYSDIGRPLHAVRYVKKRFIRKYPVYWVVLLVGSIFFVAGQSGVTGYFILENISLLRITNHDKIVSVAWTLSHEIFFYFVFLLFILSRVVGLIALSIWILLIGYFVMVGEIVMPPYYFTNLTKIDYGVFTNFVRLVSSPINLLFALGVSSFFLYRALRASRYKEKIGLACLLVGGLIFTATSIDWLYSIEDTYLGWGVYNAEFGISGFFLMIGMLSSKADSWSSKRPALMMLGDASFSIYLVHYGLQRFILNYFGVPAGVGVDFAFIVLVSVAIICGVVFYRLVEAPLLALFGRGRTSRRNGSLFHSDTR